MMSSNLENFQAQQASFQLMLRARYTLDALNQLARYLSTLPGHKNVIWFSGSFPISVLPDGDLQDPFSAVASAEEEYKETVDLLARSQVAVYPIDARGLMGMPMMSAANSGRSNVKDPTAMGKSQQKFFVATNSEHSVMTEMAEQTGGEAFVDTNDLKTAITKVMEAGSNYYTITYTPTDQNPSKDYRKIEVKLDRPGVKLNYRRSYFTSAPAATTHHEEAPNANSASPANSFVSSSMLHGAPDPVDLVFVANVRPSIAGQEAAVAQGNQSNPKISGPYRRYTVTFVANPRELDCSVTPDSAHHCVFRFLTFVYSADGTLINTQTDGLDSNLTPDRFAAFRKSPIFSFRQQISVPVKGEYYLRLGMHDDTSAHVGALELPIASVAKLPPIPTQATPAPGGSAPK